jgi:membrane-associated protein
MDVRRRQLESAHNVRLLPVQKVHLGNVGSRICDGCRAGYGSGDLMEQLLEFVAEYGAYSYALLFGYSALKSGSLPLLAGIAAQSGALDVGAVAAAAFAGGALGDEARYWAARRYGTSLMARPGRIAALVARAAALIARYGRWYMFLYRYPKGLRTIGAFPVGLTGMRWPEFAALNIASAALWSCTLVGAGYLLGEAITGAVEAGFGAASVAILLGVMAAFGIVVYRSRAVAQ